MVGNISGNGFTVENKAKKKNTIFFKNPSFQIKPPFCVLNKIILISISPKMSYIKLKVNMFYVKTFYLNK